MGSRAPSVGAIAAAGAVVWGLMAPQMAQAQQGAAQAQPQGKRSHDGEPAWVLSASAGMAQGRSSVPLTIGLGGLVPIRLQGAVMTDTGGAQAVSLARQFEGSPSDDGQYRRVWRLELESWKADVRRLGFSAGVASAPLNDSFEARGLFVNGLIRVATTERTRWWAGAGVGRVRLSVPDASATLPGCACLQAGEAEGSAMRLKGRGEWMVRSEADSRTALFVEGAYSRMPALSTRSSSGASTTYEAWGLRTVTLGLRTQF